MRVVGGLQGLYSYYEMQKWSVGIVPALASNPEGVRVPQGFTSCVCLDPTYPRISKELRTAISKFFIWCMQNDPDGVEGFQRRGGTNNESFVALAIARDKSHWIGCVAAQEIGGASVRYDRTQSVNILTGERYDVWPPPGYMGDGDIHSHNTMGAFFSSTDDRDDSAIPGAHLVFGGYKNTKGNAWKWDTAVSVVANGVRYKKVWALEDGEIIARNMVPDDLIEPGFVRDVKFHRNILDVVTVRKSAIVQRGWKWDRTRSATSIPYRGGNIIPFRTGDDDSEELLEMMRRYYAFKSDKDFEDYDGWERSRRLEKQRTTLSTAEIDAIIIHFAEKWKVRPIGVDPRHKDLPGQTKFWEDGKGDGKALNNLSDLEMAFEDLKDALDGMDESVSFLTEWWEWYTENVADERRLSDLLCMWWNKQKISKGVKPK